MKKAALILMMMFAFMKPVHADPFCPFCVPSGSALVHLAGFSVASNVGAMTGAVFVAWVFPYLNTTGEKPFEDMFTKVDYSYPQDKHFSDPTGKTFSSNGFGKTYIAYVNGVKTKRSDGY